MNAQVVNIAAYQFFTIHNIEEHQQRLLDTLQSLELKGTILLSEEGINLMIAGKRPQIDQFICFIKNYFPELKDAHFKESFSNFIPFRRTKVKLKQAIIPLRDADVKPAIKTSKHISPEALKAKLDNHEKVILLDVRNDYEIAHGTFKNALSLNLDEFDHFVNAAEDKLTDAKNTPIVMFCTGGIRCEKAGPALEQLGFNYVQQLEGGILNYFEQCGDSHYHGNCYVFDERETVSPSLSSPVGKCENNSA